MKYLSLTDLRKNLAKVADKVKAGEEYTVIYHSKPVFQIKPLETKSENRNDKYIDKISKLKGIGSRKLSEFKNKTDKDILRQELADKNS